MKKVKKAVGFFLKNPSNTILLISFVAMIVVAALLGGYVQVGIYLGVFAGLIAVSLAVVFGIEWLAKIGRKMWEENQ